MAHANTDSIFDDLKTVVKDAEDLLKATAGIAGEKVAAARERAEASVRGARERLASAQEDVIERTREAAENADEYVHRNPWQAVGIAALVGLILGLIASRRTRHSAYEYRRPHVADDRIPSELLCDRQLGNRPRDPTTAERHERDQRAEKHDKHRRPGQSRDDQRSDGYGHDHVPLATVDEHVEGKADRRP